MAEPQEIWLQFEPEIMKRRPKIHHPTPQEPWFLRLAEVKLHVPTRRRQRVISIPPSD